MSGQRLYFIDWLRVLAVALLIPFHTGMIFSSWHFHIKNEVTSSGITIVNAFIDNWHMPLLFLLSGTSTWFALKHRSPVAYVKERCLRLLVPLIFGIIFIVPPQTYCERLQRAEFSGSYLGFYAHLFNGIYPEGNFTWNHLWFLLYLFLISMAVLPLILTLKSPNGNTLSRRLFAWLAERRRIFWLFVPLAIIQMTLKVAFPGPQNIVTDWARLAFMLVIFLYGAMLYGFPGFYEALERNFAPALTAGIGILTLFLVLHTAGCQFVRGYNAPFLLQLGIKSLATFCWLIVFLRFSQRVLNFSNRFLAYANEAVLPFYILHQTVIIVIGYAIVETNFSLTAKYVSINVLAFILTTAIYETTVKRMAVLRFLFGMRKRVR